MKKIVLVLVILIAHGVTYASIPLDCCDLRIISPESNPLLKSLPDLRVEPQSALRNEPPLFPSNISDDPSTAQYDFVHQEVAFFQTTFKERFEKGLARSSRYLPMMQKIMKDATLPEDIAYLPLIESGFNPMAVSRAKATGLWQFMKQTARRYGLRVDQWIDERHDPVKSTKAAMEYLKDLYEIFGSWPLSMASYNAGEGKIGRTLATTGAAGYWELKAMGRMPLETRNYVPKFMAATMIAKNPEAYGFSIAYETPMLYDEVAISRQTPLLAISRVTGVSLAQLKGYNPELKRGTTPPNYPDYRLKLPLGKKATFLANRSELARYTSKTKGSAIKKARSISPKKGQNIKHWVKKGETIGTISKKYKVTQSQLLQANRLKRSSVIRAGRFLLIPRG